MLKMGKAKAKIECQPFGDLPRILHESLVGVVSRVVVGIVVGLVIMITNVSGDQIGK